MSKTAVVASAACLGCAALGFSVGVYYTSRKPGTEGARERSTNVTSSDKNEELESIYAEQLVRNWQFFGDGQKLIEASYVVVVGVGGVGSHCAISLARSGVGRLRFIDFDQITVSSLNRHASATRAEVGLSKVEALKIAINAISPHTEVEIVTSLFEGSVARALICEGFNGSLPDFVVDSIDNVPTKVDLITFCHRNHIRCISSGGAGGKSDPTKIRIDDIGNTTEDELARAVRLRLRKAGVTEGPVFCYSTEHHSRKLLPLHDFQKHAVDEYRPFEQFRVRIVPVIGPMPALFGQAIASYVLCELAGRPIGIYEAPAETSGAVDRVTLRNYRQLFKTIRQHVYQSKKCKTDVTNLELDYNKSRHIYVHCFKGCSVISHKQGSPGALQIVPWRVVENSLVVSFNTPNNLVCMTRPEAQRHLAAFNTSDGSASATNQSLIPIQSLTAIESIWDIDVIRRVDEALEQIQNSPQCSFQ